MILSNNSTMETIMFLLDLKISERVSDIRNFLFSKEFEKSNKVFQKNKISTYSFLVCEKVPVIIGPEEDDEDQDFIITDLYLEVSMDGGCAYFVIYTDDSSNTRVEGDITESFMLDEAFATPEDLDLELAVIIDDQQNHERHSYKAAYKKIVNYIKEAGEDDFDDTEEMPF